MNVKFLMKKYGDRFSFKLSQTARSLISHYPILIICWLVMTREINSKGK